MGVSPPDSPLVDDLQLVTTLLESSSISGPPVSPKIPSLMDDETVSSKRPPPPRAQNLVHQNPHTICKGDVVRGITAREDFELLGRRLSTLKFEANSSSPEEANSSSEKQLNTPKPPNSPGQQGPPDLNSPLARSLRDRLHNIRAAAGRKAHGRPGPHMRHRPLCRHPWNVWCRGCCKPGRPPLQEMHLLEKEGMDGSAFPRESLDKPSEDPSLDNLAVDPESPTTTIAKIDSLRRCIAAGWGKEAPAASNHKGGVGEVGVGKKKLLGKRGREMVEEEVDAEIEVQKRFQRMRL
ncbi:hypothetical protein MMC20_003386 [Loxospora ochrophaea]|nr:hypothetical protein [Loxospora ochrophaea]